jgi:cytochrome c
MAGPTLAGIFGRRMGSLAGYGYSARLAQGDVVWGHETLAQLFTEGPDVMLPGTTMPVQRLSDPEELAELLRFLERATR